MGVLINGCWDSGWDQADPETRPSIPGDSAFRQFVSNDGSTLYPAQSGRYHLYVAIACPWAHRTLLYRMLKKLEGVVTLSIVRPVQSDQGWVFTDSDDGFPDDINHAQSLHEIYTKSRPDYSGRVSVPVLWDKHTHTIVNNESADIIRMMNHVFDGLSARNTDYYPLALQNEIDSVNQKVFDHINAGVYKVGFASSQSDYEAAVSALFDTLDWLDQRLSGQRYLMGEVITEADWRLFTTLLRFDAVYHGLFKCNVKRLVDYEHLWPYTRELYQVEGVAETFDFEQVKQSYYQGMWYLNPTRIVPSGPDIDFLAAPERANF